MKRLIILFAVAGFLFSCAKAEEKVALFELGTTEESLVLDAMDGEFSLGILSDGDFTAEVTAGQDWCSFLSEAPDGIVQGRGDMTIRLHKDLNRSILRKGEITLRRMGKTLCIPVYQKGILGEGISFSGHYLGVEADGGMAAAQIITLLDDALITFKVAYSGDQQGWISGIRKQNNYLLLQVSPNQTASVRSAAILALSPDGSEDKLIVNQKGNLSEPVPISVSQLKKLAQGPVTQLSGSYLLEGIVISDNKEGNGSYNVNQTPVLQDDTRTQRTVYLQDADASSGLMVSFISASDNILARYDAVSILLDGLVLKKEASPERYSLEGLSASSVLSSRSGNSHSVPLKEKTIAELTDADIYTLVTLKDCEIPFRKGPFVPVDLRYKSVLNKYAMPLRDKEGNGTYLLSNTGCAWERDGNPIPEGCGSVTGVIVHETLDSFEWDNESASRQIAAGTGQDYIHDVGEIGRYQIRPVSRQDIRLDPELEKGFSSILMEVRYYNASFSALVKNVMSNVIYSTYPPVANPVSDNAVKGTLRLVSGGKAQSISTWRDWSHLGPLENGLIANPSGGNGVFDFSGNSAHWYIYSLVPQSALIYMDNGSAWAASGWSMSKWWEAAFSTEGLTASNFPISVQFGAENSLGEGVGAPRYWNLEYSVDGSQWTLVSSYTVPDFPIVYKRKPWQCPGFKMFSFTLPKDERLLGKDKVFLRLIPADNRAGTEDSYDGGTIVSSQYSALNYFAIRYNKN